MENLANKTALITGAGKGLGKALALHLAKEGVHLALISRTESDLLALKNEILAINPHLKVSYKALDISEIKAVNEAVHYLFSEIGKIDILINNAGVGKFGKFLDLSVEEWERIIKINLFGSYYVTRAILPSMLENQCGDIINVASTAGKTGNAMSSAYSTSKFALMGMSESLMQEARKSNIRVFTYTPSTIATDLAMDLNLTDGNPDKVLQPDDFAEMVIAHLKLNRRAVVKESSIWSTNP